MDLIFKNAAAELRGAPRCALRPCAPDMGFPQQRVGSACVRRGRGVLSPRKPVDNANDLIFLGAPSANSGQPLRTVCLGVESLGGRGQQSAGERASTPRGPTGLLCVRNTVSVRRSPHGESTPLSLPCSTATAIAREHGSRGDRRGPTKLAPHGPKAKCRARGRVSPALGHRPPAAGSTSPAPNSLVYKVGTVVPRCAASPLTILVTGGQPCSRTTKWKIPEISSS